MAFVTARTHPENEILRLFPIPLYTHNRILDEEDLLEMGLGEILDDLPDDARKETMDQAKALSAIQPELAFHFLLRHRQLMEIPGLEDLGELVKVILDIYDAQGLNPARAFLLDPERHQAFGRLWGRGLGLHSVYRILLNYLHGLGRAEIHLEEGNAHFTDTVSIFVPPRIALFDRERLNFLLFKVMVTHKFAQIRLGTYRLGAGNSALGSNPEGGHGNEKSQNGPLLSDLSRFLHSFPEPLLASDLFSFFDTARIEGWIRATLPGLYSDMVNIKHHLSLIREKPKDLTPRSQTVEQLLKWWLAYPSEDPEKRNDVPISPLIREVSQRMDAAALDGAPVDRVARLVEEIYGLFETMAGPYVPVETIPYVGELRPEEAERARSRKRESTRIKFQEALCKLMGALPEPEDVRVEVPSMDEAVSKGATPQPQSFPKFLLIDGNPIPLPEAMNKTIEEIYEDLGAIPGHYLSITSDMSGHYFRSVCQMPDGTGFVLSEADETTHVLDEWDYRRQGYRKRWALLREVDVKAGSLDFARETLVRYGGMTQQIKRQFERIRMDQALLKRQKDGDNIDLDAAVEAFTDQRAGLSPSERVFVRLSRNKRDIATAFLIDLSGSTSGWVNQIEREALLILSEAMQVLQDRFAIYGFSGRTRKRCELFVIKRFEEPYGEAIRARIAALEPREYTRLGPPIRRLTEILDEVDARTRLLITLSDGKPDDWDGYNGDYGIEDTRHALIEAKRMGIHPFCITIDKAEHSYLSHMFGAVNYVFIDDLAKLPVKIPEIYRKLTT
jgi:nitric oxide reductase NorD protein